MNVRNRHKHNLCDINSNRHRIAFIQHLYVLYSHCLYVLLIRRYVFKIKKAWVPVPVARHTLGGSRIAHLIVTSNADLTPICIELPRLLAETAKKHSERMNTSRDIYRCYVLDEILKFARFPSSKTKRQVNAFSIMSSPTHEPCRWERCDKSSE